MAYGWAGADGLPIEGTSIVVNEKILTYYLVKCQLVPGTTKCEGGSQVFERGVVSSNYYVEVNIDRRLDVVMEDTQMA